MTLTEVIIGWILGVASSTITPLINRASQKMAGYAKIKKMLGGKYCTAND
jgi:hypothetical protein